MDMAENEHVNKVELSDGTVLVDLTEDTVEAGNLLRGETAHSASGAQVTGTVDVAGTISTSDIDDVVSDQSPTGTASLRLTGLSYLWTKIKAFVGNYVQKSGDTMTGKLTINTPKNWYVSLDNLYEVRLDADGKAYNGNSQVGTWTMSQIISMFGTDRIEVTVTDSQEAELLFFKIVGDANFNYGTFEASDIRFLGDDVADTTATVTLLGEALSAAGNATFSGKVTTTYGYKIKSQDVYPIFKRSSWSTSSDESYLPVTPCFVLDTSDFALYWCDGQ